MAKAKRKTLPKNFDELLAASDLSAMKAVFDQCEINAYDGSGKETALAFYKCPAELARWLVSKGADVDARNEYQRTALHKHARVGSKLTPVLIELGADVNAQEYSGDTPLHSAADGLYAETCALLLDAGSKIDAANRSGLTPLEYALLRGHGAYIDRLADVAELLLQRGAQKTERMREFVAKRGFDFEFRRAAYNKDSVDAASAALDRLYQLFDVPPAPRRLNYDGKSPIIVKSATSQEQHDELWQLLVPASGHCSTVQGEVVRIPGKISDEMNRNGGANWDADFRKMANAFLGYLKMGQPLPINRLNEAAALVKEVTTQDGASEQLSQIGVEWVRLNPNPITLDMPAYRR